MKKKLCFLFVLPFILLACSDNDTSSKPDNVFTAPETVGSDLKEGEIQLVFSPTLNNPIFEFNVLASASSEIKVNWGDDNFLHVVDPGNIRYEYPADNKEYVITIQCPEISDFKLLTPAVSQQVKAIYFGYCSQLTQLDLHILGNKWEALDLSKCPQFHESLLLYINTPNFDYSGLKNFDELLLYVKEYSDIKIEQMNMSSLDLHFANNCVLNIDNNHNLEKLRMSCYDDSKTFELQKFYLSSPNLKELTMNNVFLNTPFKLDKVQSLELIKLFDFACNGEMDFNSPKAKMIVINNEILKRKSNIKTLDFTKCTSLEELYVFNIDDLQEYNLNNLNNLKSVEIFSCGNIENYSYTKTDSFNYNKSLAGSETGNNSNTDILRLSASRN